MTDINYRTRTIGVMNLDGARVVDVIVMLQRILDNQVPVQQRADARIDVSYDEEHGQLDVDVTYKEAVRPEELAELIRIEDELSEHIQMATERVAMLRKRARAIIKGESEDD